MKSEEKYRRVLEEAANVGNKLLQDGGSALDGKILSFL